MCQRKQQVVDQVLDNRHDKSNQQQKQILDKQQNKVKHNSLLQDLLMPHLPPAAKINRHCIPQQNYKKKHCCLSDINQSTLPINTRFSVTAPRHIMGWFEQEYTSVLIPLQDTGLQDISAIKIDHLTRI